MDVKKLNPAFHFWAPFVDSGKKNLTEKMSLSLESQLNTTPQSVQHHTKYLLRMLQSFDSEPHTL